MKGPEIATTSAKPIVAVLVCDGFAPFQFSVPCAIFGNFLPGSDLFDMRICAVELQPLHNEFGMSIVPMGGTETIATADVIVIPFWNGLDKRPSADLVNALRRANDKGAKIVGLCLGGYVLAYAGLLDHRKASTHWEMVEDFRTRAKPSTDACFGLPTSAICRLYAKALAPLETLDLDEIAMRQTTPRISVALFHFTASPTFPAGPVARASATLSAVNLYDLLDPSAPCLA